MKELKYPSKTHEEKVRRLNEWSKGNEQPPIKFSIIPTNRCNLACDACPNSVARSEGRFLEEDEISKEKWMEIVEKGLEWGVKEWRILGGGEPMVRRETSLSILLRANKESVHQDTEMITNGTLFQPGDIEKLVKTKTNRILFSIDGPDAETHDFTRGLDGAFSKATAALRYFHKVKRRTGIDKPVIQVNMVLNNKNYDRIVEMVDFVNRYGVDELALHPMREYEEIKDQMQYLKVNQEEKEVLKREIKEAEEKVRDRQVELNLDMVHESEGYLDSGDSVEEDCSEKEEKDVQNKEITEKNETGKFIDSNCFEPFYGLLITPKGLVGNCVPYGMGVESLDLEERGIKDIWYGEHFEELREKMLKHNLTESCEKCGLLDMTEELREELKKYRRLKD